MLGNDGIALYCLLALKYFLHRKVRVKNLKCDNQLKEWECFRGVSLAKSKCRFVQLVA